MAVSPEFAQLLDRLKNPDQPFPAADLYHLSDLGRPERRRAIMVDLGESGEANLVVQFEGGFRRALEDEDAQVRAAAVANLWEVETPALIAPFLELLRADPDAGVRAAAASALGRYVYLGEVEELPARHARRVEEALLAVIRGGDELEVRRRALEARSFSSRPEVGDLIAEAYGSPERLWRISAVFAMGRSADPRWAQAVLAELESGDPELRYEAARAAGELELQEATPGLKKLVDEGDVQVREAAIWSLGQVGGDEARAALLDLLQAAGDEERDFLEDALENLHFHDELLEFPLIDAADEALDDDGLVLEDDDDDLPPPALRLN